MLGEIASALSIWDRVAKFCSRRNSQKDTVASRFVRLFEAHGVHRNQIPRFFGHGLTAADVEVDARLLECLDELKLNAACELFCIRREWLDVASPTIYDINSFYKQPVKFDEFLKDLLQRSDQCGGRLLVANPGRHTPYRDYDSLMVLEELIGHVGDRNIFRYHLCDPVPLGYWKSRAHIVACVAIAWGREVYIHGDYVDRPDIGRLVEGEQFLKVSDLGGLAHYGRRWDPEDMALTPDAYLIGLDEGHFGKSMALAEWLRLEKAGWMNTGISKNTARESFEERHNLIAGKNILKKDCWN